MSSLFLFLCFINENWHDGYSLFPCKGWRSCGLFILIHGNKGFISVRQLTKQFKCVIDRTTLYEWEKILKLFLNVMYFHLKVPYKYNCKVINDIFSRGWWTHMYKYNSYILSRMHDSSRLHMKHEQNRRKNVLFIKDWGKKIYSGLHVFICL